MTTTTTAHPAAAAYLADVEAELDDLPHDDRAELLEDVEAHLVELVAEDPGPLEQRLGSPAAYAAELRAAAGLPPRAHGVRGRLGLTGPARAARRVTRAVTTTRWYAEVRAFLPELRPAWWVLRGYLVVAGLASFGEHGLRQHLGVPDLLGSNLVGLAAIAGGATVSVMVGRRRPRSGWRRTALVGVNVVTAVFAWTLLGHAAGTGQTFAYAGVPSDGGLSGPYGDITNVYPYDSTGHPLTGVLLFDQSGTPLSDYVCLPSCPAGPRGFPLRVLRVDPLTGEVVEEPPPYAVPPGATPTPSPNPKQRPTPKPKGP